MSNQTKPTHNLVYKGREFTGEDGQKRHYYPICGAVWPDEEGNLNRVMIDVLPVNFTGVLYIRPRQSEST
jgi:hypothetical protein